MDQMRFAVNQTVWFIVDHRSEIAPGYAVARRSLKRSP